jgi:hypothetical protein
VLQQHGDKELLDNMLGIRLRVLSIGDETIEGTGSINLTGVQSNTTIGTLSFIADANVTPAITNVLNVTAASISSVIRCKC